MEGFTFSVHKELIRHLLLAKISLVFGQKEKIKILLVFG